MAKIRWIRSRHICREGSRYGELLYCITFPSGYQVSEIDTWRNLVLICTSEKQLPDEVLSHLEDSGVRYIP